MLKSRLSVFVILFSLAIVAGCGGGGQPLAGGPSASAPVSVSVSDTPPAGVAVLSFEVTITSAVLNPGNVSLVSSPVEIEIKRLETEAAFLSTVNVPAGTYNSITVGLSNPELAFKNNTGATITVGAFSCASGAVCEFKPAVAGNVTFSGSPFPLTITANTPAGLLVDLSLDNVLLTPLGVNFAAAGGITVTQLPAPGPTGELEEIEDVVGQVTVKDSANNQFTLKTAVGTTLTIKVDNTTQFEDFDKVGCTANPQNFSCVNVGQIVEVDLRLIAGSSAVTLLAKKVELEADVNEEELEGVIVAINSPTQFDMVLLEEVPDVTGIDVGNLVRINLLLGAKFRVDDDGLPVSGLSFATALDLLVGQQVEIRKRSTPTGTPPAVDTDRVTLKNSRFTAKVNIKIVNNFTVNNLPNIFTAAGIFQIQVDASKAEFENVSGVTALNPLDTVSLRGLLFKTVGDPVLVADKVRKR